MKNIVYLFSIIAIGVGLTAFDMDNPLNIGDDAPLSDRQMENIDGSMTSLQNEMKENGLLVIFSCNTCPYVIAWEDEYPSLHELANEQGIGMILVNSNERKRTGDDSMENMVSHAEDAGYTMPYVVDTDSELADAFGARTTPHVYLFDNAGSLVFVGSINDKFENRDKEATQEWLRDAMTKLGSGQAADINPAETRQIGCSIKRN